MSQQVTMTMVRTLHDLATAAWIGGMLALALAVAPAVRKSLGGGPGTMQVLSSIQSRLSVLMGVAVVVLLATGLLLSRQATLAGIPAAHDNYSAALTVKHVLVGAMVIIGIVRSRFVAANNMKLKGGLLLLNLVLSVAVIALSSLIATLARMPLG